MLGNVDILIQINRRKCCMHSQIDYMLHDRMQLYRTISVRSATDVYSVYSSSSIIRKFGLDRQAEFS